MNLKKTLSLTIFCFLSLFSLNTLAQMENNGIVVRLNHKLLDFSKIDNRTITKGRISDFLNEQGKEYLKDEKYQFLLNFKFTKIFDNLKTADSISISRHGDKVYIPPFWATFHLEITPNSTSYTKVIKNLNNAYPLIIYAHYNYGGEFLSIPNDSLFSIQKSLQSSSLPNAHINMDSAWNIETGKRHIKVGIFDSGIDTTNPDLKNQILTGHGYNLELTNVTSWGSDAKGVHGHGTPVAGIVGAKRNNTSGIAGIAGGDGSDTTGVNMIDFRLSPSFNVENVSKAIIDASRSVGSYYDWTQNPSIPNEESYWSHASGYGIHLGNNSFMIKIANPEQIDTLVGNKSGDTTDIVDTEEPFPQECLLCREAYLFSLKNGVVMVASSGNGIYPQGGGSPTTYYSPSNTIPQNYDDSWIINVGGSGTNGQWFNGTNGMSYEEYWFAQIHKDIDVIAPATQALVYSTASITALDTINRYARFAGTSAAAPHVTGVAALLLSKYNQSCYTNSNLDMADVEYILEHSARDVGTVGRDDYSGYGLLDAHKALKMIDFPEYQIIHPDLTPSSITETASDTITFYLNEPLFDEAHGPVGSLFPLFLQRYYRVIRKEIQTQYDFSNYLLPSTQILDYWIRPSRTNSLQKIEDTLTYNDPFFGPLTISDTFQIEPRTEIVSFNSFGSITLKGYYYHFIGIYDPQIGVGGSITSENFWYPINPSIQSPRMAFSVYLKDSLAPFYTFSCDSLNALVDTLLNLQSHYVNPNNVFLYPNPSNGILKIGSSLKEFNLKSIELIGMNGMTVEQKNSSENIKTSLYEFDFSRLASGLYTVILISKDNQRYIKKWSKL